MSSAVRPTSLPVAVCMQAGRCVKLCGLWAAVSQGCKMPPCVPPGLSGVPSTRTNKGGPSGCSSWGRPRECALSPSLPSPTSVLNKKSCLKECCGPHGADVCWYSSPFSDQVSYARDGNRTMLLVSVVKTLAQGRLFCKKQLFDKGRVVTIL